MATRSVVLAARPGRIRQIIENPLPYPRDPRTQGFQRLVDQIHAVITETEIPDEPAPPPSGVAPSRQGAWEPLPEATASEVVGLLEVLDDRGGKENVFSLAEDLGREFGVVIGVVKAAELLDLADTPKQDVVLTDNGKKFLKLSVPDRKRWLRSAVLDLRIFADTLDAIGKADGRSLDEDVLRSSLALRLPYENGDRVFNTLVNWGRYADLFDHDPVRGRLYIEQSQVDQTPPEGMPQVPPQGPPGAA